MRRLIILTLLCLLLSLHSFASVANGQEEPPLPYSVVFDRACDDYECVAEVLAAYLEHGEKQEGTFVLRVRSDRPAALALANANLFLPNLPLAPLNRTSKPFLFLRIKSGEDVLPPSRKVYPFFYGNPDTPPRFPAFGETTELWFIPKGGAIPAHTEAVQPCQFTFEDVEREFSLSKRLRLMAVQLRARPGAYGLVRREFRERVPNLARLKGSVRRILKQYGVSPDRVLVVPHLYYYRPGQTEISVAEVLPECPEKK